MVAVVEFDAPEIGEGLYTFAEAARILTRGTEPVSERRLRDWVRSDLVPPSYQAEGVPLLSFDDLISLEMVKRFRNKGTSLQRVRVFEQDLRDHTGFERPFAYQAFFTDGVRVWGQRFGEDGPIAIELGGRRKSQLVWLDAIKTFAREITYEGQEFHASLWNLTQVVQVNPRVQFGAPVVRGTRVTVATIEANLKAGSVEQVADWYGLTVNEVRGVQAYLAAP